MNSKAQHDSRVGENDEVATKEKAALRLYGVEQGYSEQELEGC